MHIGIAHHLGWAIVVAATGDHEVVDRRRVELVDDDLAAAPIHHRSGVHPMHDDGGQLDDDALGDLAARVRASARANIESELDALVDDLRTAIDSMSLRDWPEGFPTDIGTLRRAPYESHADSVMYRQVMADAATNRGWFVHRFDAKTIEEDAIEVLGDAEALAAPRSTIGPPWNKDHRMAFAATIIASRLPG